MKSWALCLVLHLRRYCIILITLVYHLFCRLSPCSHQTAHHSCAWIFILTDILYSQHTSCLAVAALARRVGKGWFCLTQPSSIPGIPGFELFFFFHPPLPLTEKWVCCASVSVQIYSVGVDLSFTSLMVLGSVCLLCLWKHTCVFFILMCHWFSFTGREDCIKDDFWGQDERIHWSGMTY